MVKPDQEHGKSSKSLNAADQERLSEQAREIAKLWRNYLCGSRLQLVAEQYDSLARQLTEAERENVRLHERRKEANEDALRYLAALDRIAPMQQDALAKIQANGFVFEDIGAEPGNWQHLAFTLYTDLCEIDSIVSAVLDTGEAQASPPKSSSGEALDTGGLEG